MRSRGSFGILGTVVVSLLLPACSGSAGAGVALPVVAEGALVSSGAGSVVHVEPTSAATITVSLDSSLTATLDLPAGAVTEPIELFLRPVRVGSLWGVEMEPHGLFLMTPARLRFTGSRAQIVVRNGWSDDGLEQFAPTWRTAEQDVSVLRLRPFVLSDVSIGMSSTVGTASSNPGPTTSARESLPTERPSWSWAGDIGPLLSDSDGERSDTTDTAIWQLEREDEEGTEPEAEQVGQVTGAARDRGRALVTKCADGTAAKKTAAELSDLIDGRAMRITDAREVAGCLVLAWRVTERVEGQFTAGGETIEFDEIQMASTTTMIDGGTSSVTAPIIGRSNGQGALMSIFASGLGKLVGTYAGVDTPAISSKYCPPVDDQESGTMTLSTDPLADGNIRVRIDVQPGLFDVGCGPDFKVPPLGWPMVSALRGEEEGTPIVFTVPPLPQESYLLSSATQVNDSSVVRRPDGRVTIDLGEIVFIVSLVVTLAFAPAT